MRIRLLYLLSLVLAIVPSVTSAQQATRVGLRLIAVKTEGEAAGLRIRLQAGEAFEDLAKKYSIAPSARAGGWLGILRVANLGKEFQDALERLVAGEVSPTLKLNDEYVLLELVPDAEIHFALGDDLVEQGKLAEAISEFREALRIDPQYADAHYNLGSRFLELENVDEAVAEFREYIRINPENAEGHNTLGVALLERGNVDEALAEHREALRINPQYAEAHYNLGNVLGDQGKIDAALAEYREALRINPHDVVLHNNLGVALRDDGKLAEAIAEYREALGINPGFALAHYNLGESLRQQGDRTGAAREFRDFIRLAPSSSDSKERVERARSILADLERP